MHPPYSLDLAPSDFHVLGSLQNSLGRVRSTEDRQNYLSRFFEQKSKKSRKTGHGTTYKTAEVIEQIGTYIM